MSGAVFAGQLRRRVTLQIPTAMIDASGFQSQVYGNGPQVWAHIRTLRLSAHYGPDRPEGERAGAKAGGDARPGHFPSCGANTGVMACPK